MNSLLKLSLSILIITSVLQGDTFFRTYDVEGGTEHFRKAIELPDGDFAGMREQWGSSPNYSGLMFFDANGDSTDYIDEIYADAFCLTEDSSLVFVTGTTSWSLLWANLNGEILDEVIIPYILTYSYAADIVQGVDGGFFLCGDEYAVKVDGSGVYEWHLFLDEPVCIDLRSVTQIEDGTFLAGGQASGIGPLEYIVNISINGIIQWEWSQEDSWGIWGVQSVDGGFVAASKDNRITMFSASGDTLWNYSSEHGDVKYYGITVSGTDIISCGISESDSVAVVSRLDINGLLIWERDYPQCGFMSIKSTMDGGFILAGVYPFPFEIETASLLVKTDSEGWYEGLGIEHEQIVCSLDLDIYPNPTSAYTILNFNLDSSSSLSLLVFDISGKCVLEFPETQFNPGNNEIQIEGLGSGIYFCRVITGNFTATQRFIVIE